ncbi:hypothetical protein [Streptococcus suis]|uniref:hypothetical protein n=1 Tax=Streptococcus suis TaxID=1307 RepID=UPI001583AF8C|nr:hypothetical protein [Streptococcus suis]MCG9861958.1 hypothetical protein [Streptococcus suis]MCG9883311.1 hypothetical protein [Streptococcus suis]MCK3974233.1 hypothetical protein [Streptococcus suis]HEM6498892.1 hypothetical protein [Streptococcus suis]
MTEAIFTLGIFAVPILTAAVVEQRKAEKEQKRRELALLREMELETLRYETWAQAEQYYKTCQKESARNSLKRNGQQVDKEWKRYAEMVG